MVSTPGNSVSPPANLVLLSDRGGPYLPVATGFGPAPVPALLNGAGAGIALGAGIAGARPPVRNSNSTSNSVTQSCGNGSINNSSNAGSGSSCSTGPQTAHGCPSWVKMRHAGRQPAWQHHLQHRTPRPESADRRAGLLAPRGRTAPLSGRAGHRPWASGWGHKRTRAAQQNTERPVPLEPSPRWACPQISGGRRCKGESGDWRCGGLGASTSERN